MNTVLTTQRRRTNLAAVVLCCLMGTLNTPANGPFDAPGIATAAEAEKNGVPANEPEPDPANDAPAQSETSKSGEDGTPGEAPAKSDADESEEIFVPSEDISEDIDVPFPVDI